MHLALVTDGLFPISVGGMQNHSVKLARSLAAAGVRVSVIYPRAKAVADSDVARTTGLDVAGITLHAAQWPRPKRFPGHYVVELRKYSESVRRVLSTLMDVDWIYVQGLCGVSLVSDRRTVAPPIAVNLHGLEMFQRAASPAETLRHMLLRPAAKSLARNAAVSISLGGGITSILENLGVPQSRIVEIPVGIDEDWIIDLPPVSEGPRRFLFIGRHERRKGVVELNTALKALSDTNNFEFHFVGPIPAEHRIADARLSYLGPVTDRDELRTIIDNCDILVCPSLSEGMPTVILEAMARGLAVIATDVGAVNELVSSDNGWLIPPGNPETLKGAMTSALSLNAEALKAKKSASIAMVSSRFKWAQVAALTKSALESRSNRASLS